MFKLRLLSTLVLIPAVVAGILLLPSMYIAIGSAIVFGVAMWEWLRMTVLKDSGIIRFILLASLFAVAYSLLAIGFNPAWLYALSLLWWTFGLVGVCSYPRVTEFWREPNLQPLVGLIMFVPAWLAFNTLHSKLVYGPQLVLLGCVIIWGSDIGAYCFGKLWGKSKLAPQVSPGKTWAGFYGSVITGCLVMLVYCLVFKPGFSILGAVSLAIVTVLFAVVGDLVESMLKRIYGVKDSGNIIPGHGGMYDRIDSMLAAFPIYYLGLQMLQGY
jgi:phosphatidate cytidylyltransferase